MVFDHVNVTLDFRDVFVLSTKVKTDVPKAHLKGLKLRVSKSGHNAEATVAIGLNHAGEGSSHSGNLTVQKRFDSTKVKSVRDSDQEWKFIDKHQVNGQDNFLKVFENAGRHAVNLTTNRHTPVLRHLPFKGTRFGPKCVQWQQYLCNQ